MKAGGVKLGAILSDRVDLGVTAELVPGKFLGVFGAAWLSAPPGLARLSEGRHRREMAAAASGRSRVPRPIPAAVLIDRRRSTGPARQSAARRVPPDRRRSTGAARLVLLDARVRNRRIALDDV
ncbi:Na+/H+ antiporter NhaA [Nonomuraea candida]|uniref:Na+/H+ antiporter NhaA n=1 Tax=Nonomuraea candida TaxID=359159 RepID=UPI00248098A4|nr:hypothetical protein [Nonomuraea candida]